MDPLFKESCYRFNEFILDVRERRFAAGQREIRLRPRTLDTLIYLVERQGRLVTKNALLDGLWVDAEVTENTLTQCIRELREALGDDQKDPRFIQTVPRSGYRFIAKVERAGRGEEEQYEEEISA